jgi:hypothetical protein
MALFETPEQARQRERQARVALGQQSINPAQGALFNLGHSIAGAGIRYMGGDTRSQSEKAAENVQKLIGGLDMTNRASVQDVANKLQQAGYMAEAQQLMTQLPAHEDTYTTRQITGPDGSLMLVKRNDRTGEDAPVIKSGGLTVGTPDKTASTYSNVDDIRLTDDQKLSVSHTLENQPEALGLMGGVQEVDDKTAGAAREVVTDVANMLKQDYYRGLQQLVSDNKISQLDANREIKMSDSHFVQNAERLVLGGGTDLIYQENWKGKHKVAPSATLITDIQNLRTNMLDNMRKDRMEENMEAGFSDTVFQKPDPLTGKGGFNMASINEKTAEDLFRGQYATPVNNINTLKEMGYTFTPEAEAYHTKNMGLMRANQEFIERYFNPIETKQTREAMMNDAITDLAEAGQIQKSLELAFIRKYLKNLKEGDTEWVSPEKANLGRMQHPAAQINQ